jgi:hypothetical protein
VGILIAGLGRPDPAWMIGVWVAGIFVSSAVVTLVNGSNQAIWMAKVSPDVQGRVFSARRLIAWLANPVVLPIAGLLADYVMEPRMMADGAWASTFGGLVGTGPGAGMSLMFIFTAFAGLLSIAVAYFVPIVRNIEDILPDHKAEVADDTPDGEPVADATPA